MAGLACEVPAHFRGTQRCWRAQGTPKRPPALRKLQAFQAVVQVSTPAWHPRPGVGDQQIPGRHETEQTGLGRTLPAAHARTHRRCAAR